MKRLLLIIFAVIMVAASSIASPVFRTQRVVRQSDGTMLTVTRTGANHILYYITDDGYPVFPNAKGDYCYADFDDDFNVVASPVIAHEENKRTPVEQRYAADALERFESAIMMHNASRYGIGSLSQASVKSTGDVKIAVILAEFTDVSFKNENDIATFDKHFNGVNYTAEGGAGSLRDYFVAQSDSLFRPQFDVVAKVKVSHERSYYGANSGNNDKNGRGYVCEAVDSAYAHGVDFTPYLNSKGELFVIVIYPGHGEQVSGAPETLWAQYSYNLSHTIGKFKLVAGLMMDELADYGMGEQFDGIGTLAHEFSHALGLPDFYNTTSARNIFGMDAWSIMDYGQFDNLSRTPVGYSAYEREFMGWLKIETLKDEKQLVTLAPLHTRDEHRAYRIPNKADLTGNEYYLIENRQSSPWYLKLYGEGMLVTHVHYNSTNWAANTINNDYNHQRMTIIPADGVLTRISAKASDYKGDLFPGYSKNMELTSTTTPCDTAYIGGHMNIKMKNIHEISDNIVFYYQCDGQLDKPASVEVKSQTSTGVTVNFASVENAEKYEVSVYKNEALVKTEVVSATQATITNLPTDSRYVVSVKAQAEDYMDSEVNAVNVALVDGEIGDVDGNGSINATDVVSIYNYIIIGSASGVKEIRADVDGNGLINATDVTNVYNIIIMGK